MSVLFYFHTNYIYLEYLYVTDMFFEKEEI